MEKAKSQKMQKAIRYSIRKRTFENVELERRGMTREFNKLREIIVSTNFNAGKEDESSN